MTDIYVALLAAAGVLGAAAVSVLLTRTRLNRLEAVSRILKDLSPEDEAYAPLSEVRKHDASELQRSQRSPWGYFFGLSIAALVLGLSYMEFGENVQAWSKNVYFVFGLAVMVSYLVTVTMYIGFLVGGARQLIGWARDFLSARIGKSTKKRAARG